MRYGLFLIAMAAWAAGMPLIAASGESGYLVYTDSDFGFRFTYPLASASKPEFFPRGYGRCVRVESGMLAIFSCGTRYPIYMPESAAIQLRGAYEDWLQHVTGADIGMPINQPAGFIMGSTFGDNWFLAKSMQQRNMFVRTATVTYHLEFVGDSNRNSISVIVPAKDDRKAFPEIKKVIHSFSPGNLNTPDVKTDGWALH